MKLKTTKEVLVESFMELSQKKDVDKITIKEIVGNCGLSPATFYRQFSDKYDLIAWAFYVIIRNIKMADENKTLSVEVMEALAHTIDAKDEYTKGHSVRVAKYSRLLAKKLGLPPEDCENVYYELHE